MIKQGDENRMAQDKEKIVEHSVVVRNNKTYNITLVHNTPSSEGLRALARQILKLNLQ